MYTLPHQFELLSDPWLDEARSYLTREIAARRDDLAGPFSLSERFTDAPPHLGFADDVAAWSLGSTATRSPSTRGFDAAADVVVEGDYQAALTSAQRVGITAPAAAEAMWREVGRSSARTPSASAASSPTATPTRCWPTSTTTWAGARSRTPTSSTGRAPGPAGNIRRDGGAGLHRARARDLARVRRRAARRRRCGRCAEHGVTSLNWMLYQGRCVRAAGPAPAADDAHRRLARAAAR